MLPGERDRRETMNEERQDVMREIDEIYPLAALKNIVVFPHNRHALTVAREKTVRAIEEAMMRSDHLLVTSAQRDAGIDDPQAKDIFPKGTLVEVTSLHRQPDGSLQVLVRGVSRIFIEDYVDGEPFLRVRVSEVEELPQDPEQQVNASALVRTATTLFERYAQLNRRF